MTAYLLLNSWAGLECRPVEIVAETPKRYRVKLLEDVRLPGNRHRKAGTVVLVPKYAVKDESELLEEAAP